MNYITQAHIIDDEVYSIACWLPSPEHEEKLIEVGKKNGENSIIVIQTLLQPEFICTDRQFDSVCRILKELVKKYRNRINTLADGLKFYNGTEVEDVERRKRVKEIFIELSKENPKLAPKIVNAMCRIMFRNTGPEPFEIVSEILSKNVELSFILMEGLERRLLRKKEKEIEKTYLRREMMNMLFSVLGNVKAQSRALRIVRATINQLGEDRFFEDALVEIGKRFPGIKQRLAGWNGKNEKITSVLTRVNNRLRKWEQGYQRPGQRKPKGREQTIKPHKHGFRGSKHKY